MQVVYSGGSTPTPSPRVQRKQYHGYGRPLLAGYGQGTSTPPHLQHRCASKERKDPPDNDSSLRDCIPAMTKPVAILCLVLNILMPGLGENLDLSRCPEVHTDSIVRDRAYFLAKYCQTDGLLPGWTGWNQVLHKDSHPINNVGYLPIIDSSPTDKATVQTILGKNLEIAHALNLQSIVLVMNQAIYAKAQEIQWQGPLVFRDRIIVRLGEFHTAMAFLGAVGKRFQDSGLSGTFIAGLTVLCGSVIRFKYVSKQKVIWSNTWVALLQFITAFLFLLGWIWSIVWGVAFITISNEYAKKCQKPTPTPMGKGEQYLLKEKENGTTVAGFNRTSSTPGLSTSATHLEKPIMLRSSSADQPTQPIIVLQSAPPISHSESSLVHKRLVNDNLPRHKRKLKAQASDEQCTYNTSKAERLEQIVIHNLPRAPCRRGVLRRDDTVTSTTSTVSEENTAS